MKFLLLTIIMLAAACSGKNSPSASQSASSTWPAKWCEAQPGMTKDQLVSVMGQPTTAFPTQMSWSDDHYQFNAFFEDDGTVRQLDINTYSLTDAEKKALKCARGRTVESLAEEKAALAPKKKSAACEIVSATQMSTIIGAAVGAETDKFGKCIYKPAGASLPYVELTVEPGDGAAGMAGVDFAGKQLQGVAGPYDGIGDRAVAVGPALFIRTGDDLVTIVLSGVKDKPGAAKKIFEAAKAGM